MIKKLNFLIFLFFIHMNCSCQNKLGKIIYNNEYIDIEYNHINFCTIEYRNESKEIFLIWLDFTEPRHLKDYFLKANGDYVLSNMIYENILNSNNMQIGYSFVKILKPLESFRFHLGMKKNEDQEKKIKEFYPCIQVAPMNKIIENFKFDINTFPSYLGHDIFINNCKMN